MNIIILGGTNNEKGELSNHTQNRIIKCYETISESKNKDITIHFSGGYNKKFNTTEISHGKICSNFFDKINKNKYCVKREFHINNNNTVDEAINFGDYLKYCNEEIKIITNDWHKERVEHLFNKTFDIYKIKKYVILATKSDYIETNILKNENEKVKKLKLSPYGLWKNWLIKEYYIKYLNIVLIEKNDTNGKIILDMRNENNEFCFNKNKFYWNTFKNIFYNKYFSNEIPPFFVILDKKVIGFIGCKTIDKNVNDIGIMFFKKYQNRGLGKVSLKKFLEIYIKKYLKGDKVIIAKILRENIASYKIFISNGFKINKDKTTNDIYYLTF